MPFPCAFPLCTRLSAFPYWQTREDYIPTDAELAASIATLPKVDR